MAKNIYSLNLLRNGSAYASKQEALTALKGASALENVVKKDGVAVLARYIHTEGEGSSQVKQIRTLVGYYAEASAMTSADGAISHMTIVDVEGTAADVEELRNKIGTGVTTANTVTKQLQDLSGTTADTSATTSVAGAKKYADGKVAEELSKLTATTVAGESKIVSDVTQANGKITATAKNLTAVKLEGYTEGTDADIAATDTLGQALGKLQGQINAMDKAASSADGEVVITVVETDGKVTEEKSKLKDVLLTGYAKTNDTGDIAAADSVNVAFSKLENKVGANKITNADKSIVVTEPTGEATTTDIKVNIKNGEKVIKLDSNGIYTDIKLSAVTVSDTNVKEAWGLFTGTEQLGSTIKIYKDSAYKEIYLGSSADTINTTTGEITKITGQDDQSLNYAYMKADGTYDLVKVDVSKFLTNSEFASGVTSNAQGVVHGVVDTSSEKNSGGTAFLTVGEGGFKVDGIKQEIINRINELDATVTGGTTAGTATNGHIQVVVAETDGKLTGVTVTETNIADADDLAALSAKTVTEIASSNDSITATSTAATDGTVKYDIITDASKIKMTGFTSTDVLSGINATSSVTEAFKVVDKVITDNEQIVSSALNDLEATKVENITVNGVNGTFSDKIASVTIDGGDIKLDGYASGSSSASVVSTDTVNEAIGKLENQVKAAVAGGLQAVESGDGISVSAVANNKQTISVKLKDNVTVSGNEWENPLKFDATSKGLYFDSLDCGTY